MEGSRHDCNLAVRGDTNLPGSTTIEGGDRADLVRKTTASRESACELGES